VPRVVLARTLTRCAWDREGIDSAMWNRSAKCRTGACDRNHKTPPLNADGPACRPPSSTRTRLAPLRGVRARASARGACIALGGSRTTTPAPAPMAAYTPMPNFEPCASGPAVGTAVVGAAVGAAVAFVGERCRVIARRSPPPRSGASPGADVGESRSRCGRVPAQMWASPGADVGESRRRCGSVPTQMWISPGADVGESQRRCGSVPMQMWISPGADVGESRRRCARGPWVRAWAEWEVSSAWVSSAWASSARVTPLGSHIWVSVIADEAVTQVAACCITQHAAQPCVQRVRAVAEGRR
jgi:hypothetical protein